VPHGGAKPLVPSRLWNFFKLKRSCRSGTKLVATTLVYSRTGRIDFCTQSHPLCEKTPIWLQSVASSSETHTDDRFFPAIFEPKLLVATIIPGTSNWLVPSPLEDSKVFATEFRLTALICSRWFITNLSSEGLNGRDLLAELPHARLASAPLFTLAIAISSGILAGHHFALQSKSILILSISVGAGVALCSIALISKRKLWPASIVLVVAFFCSGFVLSQLENRPIVLNRIARMYDAGLIAAGEPVELTGLIQGQPEAAPDSFYFTLRAESIRFKGTERNATGTLLLLAHARAPQIVEEYDALELRHGARVRVMTTLDREDNFRNPGASSFTEYLERKSYDATGVLKSPLLIERLNDERVFLPLAWLYEWRQQLQRGFSKRFSPETAGVLGAALLGNQYNISRAAAERFRAGGTFHVLVISGLQIAFIGGVVLLIVRRVTRRKLLQFVLAATFLWAYTIAVGADPSVVRSALMFTTVALAPVVARRANTLNSLGGAALLLLVWKPGDLFDPSFQLTFLSVLSIVALAVPLLKRMQQVGSWRPTMDTPYPPDCPEWFRLLSEALFWSDRAWREEIATSNISYRLFKTPIAARLERWHVQQLLRFAVAAIVVSASVQAGMLPLLVIYFHRLSMASLLLNIFVGALMAMLAFVALAAVLLSHLSLWLGTLLVWLAEKINWLMIHLVDPFTSLRIASIRLPHYSGWPASIYVLYYLPLGFLVFALARWNPLRPASIVRIRSKIFSARRLRIARVTFAAAIAVIVFHPFSAAGPDGKLHVDFLDVGQGDSALLTMPDGTTILVDGGGRPNINRSNADDVDADETFERDTRSIGEGVVSEYLWARGLDRVDYILATHADADHIDGLNDVARNFKVRGAIVARTPAHDPEYSRFATTMKETGVPVQKIGAGDVLRVGNVTAQILWPPPSIDDHAPSRNNDSIMLLLRFGDRGFLLTGDIEKEGEASVLKEGTALHSDVVKVAHHGSKTSSTEPFVNSTRPSLAIISVGRHSIFGHPNKEVVERWRAGGAEVITTGKRGTITVVTDGRGLNVSTFVKE
jgi:competence protein ComEC